MNICREKLYLQKPEPITWIQTGKIRNITEAVRRFRNTRSSRNRQIGDFKRNISPSIELSDFLSQFAEVQTAQMKSLLNQGFLFLKTVKEKRN